MKILNSNPLNHSYFRNIEIGEVFKPNDNKDYYFLKIQPILVDHVSLGSTHKINAIIIGKTDKGSAEYIGRAETFDDYTIVTTYSRAYICLGNAE